MGNAEKLRAVLVKQRKKTAAARLQSLLLKKANTQQHLLNKLVKLAFDGTAPSRSALLNKPAPKPALAQPPVSPKPPALSPRPAAAAPKPTGVQQPGQSYPIGTYGASVAPKSPANASTPGAIPYGRGPNPATGINRPPVGYVRPEDPIPAGYMPYSPNRDPNLTAESTGGSWYGYGFTQPPAPTDRYGNEIPMPGRTQDRMRIPDVQSPSPFVTPRGTPKTNEQLVAENASPANGMQYSPDQLAALQRAGVISPEQATAAASLPNPVRRVANLQTNIIQSGMNALTGVPTMLAGSPEFAQQMRDLQAATAYDAAGAAMGFNPAAQINVNRAVQQATSGTPLTPDMLYEGFSPAGTGYGMQTKSEAQQPVVENLNKALPYAGDTFALGQQIAPYAIPATSGLKLLSAAGSALPLAAGGSENAAELAQSNAAAQFGAAGAKENAREVKGLLGRQDARVTTTQAQVKDQNGRPVVDPRTGQPVMEQQFVLESKNPYTGEPEPTTVPFEIARAAGIVPMLQEAAAGNISVQDAASQISTDAANLIAKNPRAATLADWVNKTGKAPPETTDLANKTLQDQGKTKEEAQSLMDWWGEPGNMATALGIGASAIGLMMMFMGGQDGLMGWLLPALGVTMAAGGLGTLGYQGAFGKDIQNTIQGMANPLMQQLGGIGYDAGFINRDQFWNPVLQKLTPAQRAQLESAHGAVNRNTPGYKKLLDYALGGKVSDEQIIANLPPEQRALFDQLPSDSAKADVIQHLRGEAPLPGMKPFQQPATGPQLTDPTESWLNWFNWGS